MIKEEFLFEQKVGVTVGENYWFAVHYGGIFEKIIAFKDKIIIKYGVSKVTFKKRDIQYIKKYEGIFGFLGALTGRGIIIHHNRRDVAPYIAIWHFPKDRDRLFNELKKIGYKVK